MTHEKFSSDTIINLIINNDIEGLKSFISDILSAIDDNSKTIRRNNTILRVLEAAEFEETDQYEKLREVNRDLKKTNPIYSKLYNQARIALSNL